MLKFNGEPLILAQIVKVAFIKLDVRSDRRPLHTQ